AARIQAQRLPDGARALDERGLDTVRGSGCAPGAAAALDAALRTEGPADARTNRVVLISVAEPRGFETDIGKRRCAARGVDHLRQGRAARSVVGRITAIGRYDAVRTGRKAAGAAPRGPGLGLALRASGERHRGAAADRAAVVGEGNGAGRSAAANARGEGDTCAHARRIERADEARRAGRLVVVDHLRQRRAARPVVGRITAIDRYDAVRAGGKAAGA